jgi:hypothetical protein
VVETAARYHHTLGIDNLPPVDFTFDEQGGLGDDAALWYGWLKDERNPSIRKLMGSTPIFRNDKEVVPLQAADMYAWHLRREYERGGSEHLPALDLLRGRGAYIDIDVKHLKRLAAQTARVPGVQLIQTKAQWRGTRAAIRAMVARGDAPPRLSHLKMQLMSLRLKLNGLRQRARK